MRDRSESQDALAARIAATLKTCERADPTFADRVMRAVREEERGKRREPSLGTHGSSPVPHPSSSWWRRSVTVRVNPLHGLALAAGLAAVMLAGAGLLSKRDRAAGAPHSVAGRSDTVQVVRFVFVAPGASSVAVAGDFNRWDATTHQLVPTSVNGVWTASVPLPHGRHEYAFVIDGTRWVVDPAAAASVPDEFGGRSSIVTVGSSTRPRSS